MPLFNLFKAKCADPEPNKASFVQPSGSAGLVVVSELEKALQECKSTVERIAKECRAQNRKFRDIEFDLENDQEACLNGLVPLVGESYSPSDVRRVNQIFENPQFFIDGADSNDIVQGAIGDCWFLASLATTSTKAGLVEKFCVARDEEIGIYGFIFYKDDHWVHVIIDDLLYTAIPKFEELSAAEKSLYHNDKERYNKSARKGSQTLYFAKSGTDGETWVPLIEKAYAKLHGDYASLSGGYASEGVEDLTGGISSYIQTKDICNIDKFWTEELLKANDDRLFGCSFQGLDGSRSGDYQAKIFGLIGNHAYSVLRAVEAKGKRFVVVRNPWGKSEWTGPWSDGSKEWSQEWLEVLPLLGHVFGDDGQFVMEYSDFLECWDQLDRTLLFDSNWITSSQWLRVTTRPLPSAWTFGDVCFTITIPKPSFTILVLSQLDSRYFNDISGRWYWSFDFLLFKRGQTEPLAMSSQPRFYSRSVNLELNLEAGDYVVHVRLDRNIRREKNYYENSVDGWNQRKLSRVLTAKAQSQSIVSNFKAESQGKNLVIPVEALAGLNFADMEKKAIEEAEAQKKEAEAAALLANPPPPVVTTTTTTTTTVTTISADGKKTVTTNDIVNEKPAAELTPTPADSTVTPEAPVLPETGETQPAAAVEIKPVEPAAVPAPVPIVSPFPPSENVPEEVSEDDTVYMGLRVYTDKDGGAATIGGQLRHEMEAAFAKLNAKPIS
ncbi:cysteine proteinase [Mycena crocata]|nr:cysteine proteinase [Mycena crocata]